jgi:UDP-glucuronate 4-epimerase
MELTHFIELIEDELGKKAEKQFLDMQPGDVAETYANIDDLFDAVGFKPETPVKEGIQNFISWYKEYYKI